jgi:hypothetical protein
MADDAVDVIRRRASLSRDLALDRWRAVTDRPMPDELTGGRLTVNFHPDRRDRTGRTVAAALHQDGRYLSQWHTGISNGSRSAIPGGLREGFERALFGAAVDAVYGAWDLLSDPHGGSPFFGSCFFVLAPHVHARTTLCVGDSHLGPDDVGTFDGPWSILAGLAEQAAGNDLLGRPLGLDVLRAALGAPWGADAPARVLDRYVEAQVHGSIDLARDVVTVVVDPSFAGTDVETDLLAAADRYGIGVQWHGGSRLRTEDGVLDARAIGAIVDDVALPPPTLDGDAEDSARQLVKHLWQRTLRDGHDGASMS